MDSNKQLILIEHLNRARSSIIGVTPLSQDYNLFVAGRPIFVEDDVQNVFPVSYFFRGGIG